MAVEDAPDPADEVDPEYPTFHPVCLSLIALSLKPVDFVFLAPQVFLSVVFSIFVSIS